MTPLTPSALRASLDARLLLLAADRATDVNRLRRHLTFQRILRRLDADGSWVLKGGFLLEARLGARSRATRDLDLASTGTHTVDELRDAVLDALADDVDRDGFVFLVTGSRSHLPGSSPAGPGLHLSVSANLAGRPFATVRLDVVARPEEIDGGVTRLELAPVVAVDGWAPVSVRAVDPGQHAAEKLHALSAVDAHPRPSTRTKDLVDLVLLLDSGVLDESHAAGRLDAVFMARDGVPPPSALPDPPSAWRQDYATLATAIGLETGYDDARTQVTLLYSRLLSDR